MGGLKTILLVFISLFLVACTTTKTTSTKAKKRSLKFLMRQLEKNHIGYDWFACRAKIKFDSEQQKATFVADVRMKKDSLIWIRVKKMSVEGFRIKITPTSIEILKRQTNEYVKEPFSYLKNEFGLELDFSELQELLIGNPILHLQQTLVATIRENQNVLKTPESQKSVLKIFLDPKTFFINEIRGSMNNNSIGIEYSDYQAIDKQQIPSTKTVQIDSKAVGPVDLKMSFSKMLLNVPQKVGFIVPDGYRRG